MLKCSRLSLKAKSKLAGDTPCQPTPYEALPQDETYITTPAVTCFSGSDTVCNYTAILLHPAQRQVEMFESCCWSQSCHRLTDPRSRLAPREALNWPGSPESKIHSKTTRGSVSALKDSEDTGIEIAGREIACATAVELRFRNDIVIQLVGVGYRTVSKC